MADDIKRRIFRLSIMFVGQTKSQEFQYEDELAQALYIFAQEFFKVLPTPGEYWGLIYLVGKYGKINYDPKFQVGLNVFLQQADRSGVKLNAIKELREIIPGLKLKEAKDLVDAADKYDVHFASLNEIPTGCKYLTFIWK